MKSELDSAHAAKANHWPGFLMAAAGAIAFSGKAIIVKLAYRYDVDAVTVIMYRMLFALPMFLALAWWSGRGKPRLTLRDWGVLGGLGFSGYYLSSFLDFAGLQYITASLERLILYLNPTIVLLVGLLLYQTKVTGRQWLALGFSYLGVLVVFGHDISLEGGDVALGAALVFASAVSYALYLVFSGQAVKKFGALRLTGVATSIACLLCIAQFFILRPPGSMVVAPEVIWLSLLNATLCTFCPVLLVMMAIERIGAGLSAQIGMVGPLSTITMGVLILGEPFTVWVMLGTALVMLGIWLLTRRKT
jgi:drug/metabolite transporter (DMT)-like permease